MPKWSQNRCQHSTQFNAKTCIETNYEIYQNHVFQHGKIMLIHRKSNAFEGFAGCVREQKEYQKSINNYTQIHPKIYEKSMLNLCSKK